MGLTQSRNKTVGPLNEKYRTHFCDYIFVDYMTQTMLGILVNFWIITRILDWILLGGLSRIQIHNQTNNQAGLWTAPTGVLEGDKN